MKIKEYIKILESFDPEAQLLLKEGYGGYLPVPVPIFDWVYKDIRSLDRYFREDECAGLHGLIGAF